MNGYGLIAAIVQALAWPGLVFVLFWMFRERLAALLPLLRVKHKATEVSFRFEQAEKEAQALPAPLEGGAAKPIREEIERFEQVAKLSPRGAIAEVRAELEEALAIYARIRGLDDRATRRGLLHLTRELRKNDLINSNMAALLDDLRAIGNTAVHDVTRPLTEDEALQFRRLADQIIWQLDIMGGAAQMPPPKPLGPKTP